MRAVVLFITLLVLPAYSTTIEVPGDFPSIQGAIDAALGGDTVLVGPGTYVEKIDFSGKAIVVMSSQGASVTTIDGAKTGSVVTFDNNEGKGSVLEGFTITGGSGTFHQDWEFMGGGICCSGASPVIRKNIITENQADNGGGIFVVSDSSPLIAENVISANWAHDTSFQVGGAGIGVGDFSAPEIRDNEISGNTSDAEAGGIGFIHFCSPKILNNVIDGNYAEIAGGGVAGYQNSHAEMVNNCINGNDAGFLGGGIMCGAACTLTLMNNLIYDNTSGFSGGGIGSFDSELTLTNNSIYGNSTLQDGGGLSCYADSYAEIVNTIFWDNDAPLGPELSLGSTSVVDIRYSDVRWGEAHVYVETGSQLNWGGGMLENDPTFDEPWFWDFHLTHYSPCRDAGDPTLLELPAEDFEGDPRSAGGITDMGADEFYTHLYYTGKATPGGNITGKLVGDPGAAPVGLWFAFGVLDPPLPSAFGLWYLEPPWVGPVLLPSLPVSGILRLPATLQTTPPAPYDLPMQAFIAGKLTNLCVMKVR